MLAKLRMPVIKNGGFRSQQQVIQVPFFLKNFPFVDEQKRVTWTAQYFNYTLEQLITRDCVHIWERWKSLRTMLCVRARVMSLSVCWKPLFCFHLARAAHRQSAHTHKSSSRRRGAGTQPFINCSAQSIARKWDSKQGVHLAPPMQIQTPRAQPAARLYYKHKTAAAAL